MEKKSLARRRERPPQKQNRDRQSLRIRTQAVDLSASGTAGIIAAVVIVIAAFAAWAVFIMLR
jgi:hypothetical protein